MELILKWGSEKRNVIAELEMSYGEFQELVYSEFKIPVHKQRIFLKHKGKTPDKDLLLKDLKLRNKQKISIIGPSEENMHKIKLKTQPTGFELIGVVNDLDFEDEYLSAYKISQPSKAKEKLKELLKETKENNRFNFIHEPRHGKKCVILDLDRTILHFSSKASKSRIVKMARPFMHDFLSRIYQHYDIGIWSQTKWSWVEIKLYELGIINHPEYRICFALDDSHTIPVNLSYKPRRPAKYRKLLKERSKEKVDFTIDKNDVVSRPHQVKPLQLIWSNHSKWSERNTIHVDDLAKNFVMNPSCGLECSPYDRKLYKKDKELLELAKYLEHLANKDIDFSTVNHSAWRKLMFKTAMSKIKLDTED